MGCSPDCSACAVADRDYGMTLTFALTLKGTVKSPGFVRPDFVEFAAALRGWLDRLPSQAFARTFVGRGVRDGVHAHLVLGGVSYAELRRLISRWPWDSTLKTCWDRWGWLHYIAEHRLAAYVTDDFASHWRPYVRTRVGSVLVSRAGGRAKAASMTPAERSAHARTMADKRWAGQRALSVPLVAAA